MISHQESPFFPITPCVMCFSRSLVCVHIDPYSQRNMGDLSALSNITSRRSKPPSDHQPSAMPLCNRVHSLQQQHSETSWHTSLQRGAGVPSPLDRAIQGRVTDWPHISPVQCGSHKCASHQCGKHTKDFGIECHASALALTFSLGAVCTLLTSSSPRSGRETVAGHPHVITYHGTITLSVEQLHTL